MTRLVVNDLALQRSSHGAKRYANGILCALNGLNFEQTDWGRWGRWSRLRELSARGWNDQVLWSPSQRGPLFARRHVVTVLDCINIEYVYRDDWRVGAFRQLFAQVLRNAAAVVTISHATKAAVLRNYTIDAARITVIAGPTADIIPRPPQLEAPPPREAFVMIVANALPHKNVARAVRAFMASRSYRDGVHLRILGAVDPETAALISSSSGRIEAHRAIADAQLSEWLAATRLLVSPSLDEGLNLPIAEALAHRAMVAASDIAVHREFYANAVEWFDPLNEDSMRDAMDRAIEHPWPDVRRGLPADAPTFADVAYQYRRVFDQVAASRARS